MVTWCHYDTVSGFPGGVPGKRRRIKAQRGGSWNVYFESRRLIWLLGHVMAPPGTGGRLEPLQARARVFQARRGRTRRARELAVKPGGEGAAGEAWRARVLPAKPGRRGAQGQSLEGKGALGRSLVLEGTGISSCKGSWLEGGAQRSFLARPPGSPGAEERRLRKRRGVGASQES